jgi:hypothetical protein
LSGRRRIHGAHVSIRDNVRVAFNRTVVHGERMIIASRE